MKTTLCFLFLQLISSLCSGQLQPQLNSDISPLGKELTEHTRGPHETLNQQLTWKEDVNAVLREMSAMLAEQRVEIRQLQKENQGQTAKLESQKIEFEKQKIEFEKQKTEVEKQKTEVEKQKTEVDKLKEQLQAQTAELSSLKARTDVTEIHVEELKTDKQLKQVAFSASLLASGAGYFGPFNTETAMVFRHVVTNIGNAYNPNTGSYFDCFFTAPVRGVYHFDFYVYALGHPSYGTGALLVKNGYRVLIAFEHQPSHAVAASNGGKLLLEVGDVVYLQLVQNTRVYDNVNHHTTFSGHLLFTM
ncbi:uncharacterized protein LOC142886079 [Nelusetta ayraudi]|uniref:uncharacterized protein LOC142886079 n=1 Tax=Nelusetta ayraudi TaxID=303726 RepID=UPI003F72A5B8